MADVRALLPLAAAVVAGTAMAGCGGGGGEAATTTAVTPLLTHQQLISRGNQVCMDTDLAVQELGQPTTHEPSYWDKLIPLSEEALGKMARLRPPAKDRAGFAEMMQLARQEVAAIEEIRDAIAKANLAEAGRRLRVATALDTKVKFAARDVGLDFCSKLLSNWPA
jgi:hypothetical protein